MTRWTLSRRALLGGLAAAVACEPGPNEAKGAVHVAVASNFGGTLRQLGRRFQESSGAAVRPSAGSSGKLYAQIDHGAPFDVFLSADRERPRRLLAASLAVKGSGFTYALGRLALYGPAVPKGGARIERLLASGRFQRLAIANPDTAPYGSAAIEVLDALGLHERVEQKLVRGENIAQTHQFVDTSAAELGFVALSQVVAGARFGHVEVPARLHGPIAQDAVLLRRAKNVTVARGFLEFLRSKDARAVIRAAGYGLPE